jgi:hypothetical protein
MCQLGKLSTIACNRGQSLAYWPHTKQTKQRTQHERLGKLRNLERFPLGAK